MEPLLCAGPWGHRDDSHMVPVLRELTSGEERQILRR